MSQKKYVYRVNQKLFVVNEDVIDQTKRAIAKDLANMVCVGDKVHYTARRRDIVTNNFHILRGIADVVWFMSGNPLYVHIPYDIAPSGPSVKLTCVPYRTSDGKTVGGVPIRVNPETGEPTAYDGFEHSLPHVKKPEQWEPWKQCKTRIAIGYGEGPLSKHHIIHDNAAYSNHANFMDDLYSNGTHIIINPSKPYILSLLVPNPNNPVLAPFKVGHKVHLYLSDTYVIDDMSLYYLVMYFYNATKHPVVIHGLRHTHTAMDYYQELLSLDLNIDQKVIIMEEHPNARTFYKINEEFERKIGEPNSRLMRNYLEVQWIPNIKRFTFKRRKLMDTIY